MINLNFILKDLNPLFSTSIIKSYSTYNKSKRSVQDAHSENIIVIKDIDWTNRYQISKEIRESLTKDKKAFWEYFAGMIDAKGNITFSSIKNTGLITIYGNEDNLSLFVHIVNNLGGDQKGSYILDNWYTKSINNPTEICLRIYGQKLIELIATKINGLILSPSKVKQFKKLCQSKYVNIPFKNCLLPTQNHKMPNSFFMGYFDMKGRLEIYFWKSKFFLKILTISHLYDNKKDLKNKNKALEAFLSYFKGMMISNIASKNSSLLQQKYYSSWTLTSKIDHLNFLNYAKVCPSLVKHSNQINMIDSFYSKDPESYEDLLEFQIHFNNN